MIVPLLFTNAVPCFGIDVTVNVPASIDVPKSALSLDNTETFVTAPCDKVTKSLFATGASFTNGSNTVISNGLNGQPVVWFGPHTGT